MSTHQRALMLHAEAREELTRADSKATTLSGLAGIALAAILAGAIAGDLDPASMPLLAEIAFWGGAALLLVSEVELMRAVIPAVDHDRAKDHLYYFGHVVQHETKDQMAEALREAPGDEERTIDQLWEISRIAQRKYVRVHNGLLLFGAGAASGAAVVVINALS